MLPPQMGVPDEVWRKWELLKLGMTFAADDVPAWELDWLIEIDAVMKASAPNAGQPDAVQMAGPRF